MSQDVESTTGTDLPEESKRLGLPQAVALIMGGIIGTALGIVGSVIIASFGEWPTIVRADSVVLAFGFSVLVGVFFGFYPARKAARLDPIEALRYE